MIDVDDAGSIGKRYRRQDEVGTPLCVTVDFDSLDDAAVTVRDRDTMEQHRIPIDQPHRRSPQPPRRTRVSKTMADYYEMLGVDEDAPVDDIRTAYRDKRAAALDIDDSPKNKNKDRDAERARAEAAALNKAWNVLSDPYQRGRYDERRASGDTDLDDDDVDEDDDGDDDAGRADGEGHIDEDRRADVEGQRRAERRGPTPPPTVTLPAGMHFPSTRRRLTAMGIDFAVLVAIMSPA